MFQVLPDLPWVAIKKRNRIKAGRRMMLEVVERAKRRSPGASILRSLDDLNLSSTALRDEILLIMLAGHHTTGSAAAWLLYYIATKPRLAAMLADEAAAVSTAGGDIDPAKLARGHVSRATALEVLRLYPSSYWYARELKQSLTLAGIKLRTGTSLIVSPWHLHRDRRYWNDPLTFDIDRAHMANKAFVPFGAGPRACVGMGLAMMEMQILALQIASSCQLAIKSATPPPIPKPSITLVPPAIEIEAQPSAILSKASRRLIA
jgi:cytochrome P450